MVSKYPQKHADGCPFCLRNDQLADSEIVAKEKWAILVHEYSQTVPGTLQILPIWHEMSVLRWLLFLWSFFWLTRKLPRGDRNISINFGPNAGQTQPHPHVWIIPRGGKYAGKGLAHYVSLEERARRLLDVSNLKELIDREVAKTQG